MKKLIPLFLFPLLFVPAAMGTFAPQGSSSDDTPTISQTDAEIATKKQMDDLTRAVQNKNLDKIREFFSGPNPNPNNFNSRGDTPLIEATSQGNIEVLQELLKQPSTDPNFGTNFGGPLHEAIRLGNLAAVQELLKHERIDVNLSDLMEETALIKAAEDGHLAIVQELLKHPRIDVNLRDCRERTALVTAARNGHLDVVRLLLQDDRIGVKPRKDMDDLTNAVQNKNFNEIRKFFSGPNPNPNGFNSWGDTPLIEAIRRRNIEVLRELLKQPSTDPNFCCIVGTPPLIRAIELSNMAAVQELLKHERIDVNLADFEGNTALTTAAKNGQSAMVQELLKHKRIDVNLGSPFMIAARTSPSSKENLNVVGLLLEDPRVDVSLEDHWRTHPLVAAAHFGDIAMVQELLTHKRIVVNLPSELGKVALMDAVEEAHDEVVSLILKQHTPTPEIKKEAADYARQLRKENYSPTHRESYKKIVFMFDPEAQKIDEFVQAAARGNTAEVEKWLRNTDRDPNDQNLDGETALIAAAKNGQKRVIEQLLNVPWYSLDRNVQDEDGYTALMCAAQEGHISIVDQLVEEGAYVHCQAKNGYTALMFAAEQGREEIVRRLLASQFVEVNTQSKRDQSTALMLAILGGPRAIGVVKLLVNDPRIDLNAKASADKRWGSTALDIAITTKNTEAVNLIEAKINAGRAQKIKRSDQTFQLLSKNILFKTTLWCHGPDLWCGPCVGPVVSKFTTSSGRIDQ